MTAARPAPKRDRQRSTSPARTAGSTGTPRNPLDVARTARTRPAPAPGEDGGAGAPAAERPALGTFTGNPSGIAQAPIRSGRRVKWLPHGRNPFAGQVYDRSDPGQRQDRRDHARAERWALRRAYRKVTESKRVAACGRPGARPDGSVVLRVTDATRSLASTTTGATGRIAGYGGLFSCGNVHVCAECSAKVSATRATELEKVLAHFLTRGGWAVLVTLTTRHHRTHPLAQCLEAVSAGWSRVTTGRAWTDHRKITGYAGFARALEVTESPANGWHAHVHAVLVFDQRPSDDALAVLTEGMFQRWSAGVQSAGMPAPSRAHGLDVQQLDPEAGAGRTFETVQAWARYITKGLAGEAVLGTGKEAKGSNRSIRELMRDALLPQVWEHVETGETATTIDLTARDRVLEYERAMKGRKQLTWSRGLRALADLDDEQSDEEVAAAELEGEDVAVLPSESWRAIEYRAAELVSVTEREGPAGAHAWLDALGVEWWRPTRLTESRRHGERPGDYP